MTIRMTIMVWVAERWGWFNERFRVIEPDDFSGEQVQPYLWLR